MPPGQRLRNTSKVAKVSGQRLTASGAGSVAQLPLDCSRLRPVEQTFDAASRPPPAAIRQSINLAEPQPISDPHLGRSLSRYAGKAN